MGGWQEAGGGQKGVVVVVEGYLGVKGVVVMDSGSRGGKARRRKGGADGREGEIRVLLS